MEAQEEIERTAETVPCSDDTEILFEQILADVRASNCRDKTRFLIDSVNDEIKDVMSAINKYGKDGQIKITLKFKCVQANEMIVSAELESKKPRGQATGTKMFRDLKGRLYLDDPCQMKMFDTNRVAQIKR